RRQDLGWPALFQPDLRAVDPAAVAPRTAWAADAVEAFRPQGSDRAPAGCRRDRAAHWRCPLRDPSPRAVARTLRHRARRLADRGQLHRYRRALPTRPVA